MDHLAWIAQEMASNIFNCLLNGDLAKGWWQILVIIIFMPPRNLIEQYSNVLNGSLVIKKINSPPKVPSLHQAKPNPLCYFYICPRTKFWCDRSITHPMQKSNWVFIHSPIISSLWQYMQFLLECPAFLHILKYHINSYQCDIPVIPCSEGIFSKASGSLYIL